MRKQHQSGNKKLKMDYLSSVPSGCISDILSLTSPRDVCRSSATSRGINSEANSDSVWERFLPSDYQEILSRSLAPVVFPTKKQLFLGLSHSHILIHDANMSFGLDKETGKKCYMIGARLLTIIWASSEYNYWSWISFPGSRFAEVARLNIVYWLEIKGRIDTRLLSWKTTYVAYLVYKLEHENFGFSALQLKASIKYVQDGLDYDDDEYSIVYLKDPSSPSELLDGRLPRNRSDGWKEIELGEVLCDDGNNGEVEMRLLGMDGYSDKTGLIVLGIELRPKRI